MSEEEPWKALYRYWLSRCVDGRPPKRSELDIPVEIPDLLSHLMLVETVDDRLRYRLVGSAIWERYAMDLTGTWIEERNPAEAEWRATLVLVRNDRMPRLLSSPVPGTQSRTHVAVALPLLDEADAVQQILAGTFYALEFGESPRIGRVAVQEILREVR
jgi:hypothetical protein